MEKVNKLEAFLKKFFLIAGVLLALYIANLWNTGELSRLFYLTKNPRLQLFTIVVVSILLEAIPFTFIGSLMSGIIEVFVPEKVIQNLFSKKKGTSILAGCLMGMIFPVCSCGIIPVARRLLKKRLPVPGIISYLLAAPIINPITILSTAVAFSATRGAGIVFGRIFFAFAVAAIAGYTLGVHKKEEMLREGELSCHIHHHAPSKFRAVFSHAENDFLLVGKYVIFGTIIAGFFQAFVPRHAFVALASNSLASIGFMEILAIVLSMCSFADAFVASSFTSLPALSQIVFMTAGPTTSLALIILYMGTFKKKFAVKLVVTVSLLIFALGVIVTYVIASPWFTGGYNGIY